MLTIRLPWGILMVLEHVLIGPLGVQVIVTEEDLAHAMLHSEVTLFKIKGCITQPDFIVKSMWCEHSCLFYKIKMRHEYFVCVVEVVGQGKAYLRTAYETTSIKNGKVLFQKGSQHES